MVQMPGTASTDIQLSDTDIETAKCLRLLLKLATEHRLDINNDQFWAAEDDLFSTLRLAKKYSFDSTYLLGIMSCFGRLSLKSDFQDALRVFRFAALLDEEELAQCAVKIMVDKQHSQSGIKAFDSKTAERDAEWAGAAIKENSLDIATWSVQEASAIPFLYSWAYSRACRAAALPNYRSTARNTEDIPARFINFLHLMKR